jgi:hypothetical protein
MTRDDIIRMAWEAGDVEIDRRGRETFSYDSYGLERFAALVAAAERDACALAALDAPIKTSRQDTREACANAIRARGQDAHT